MVKALLGKSPLGIQLEESCLYVAADPAMQYQVALDGGDLLTPGLTPEQALGAIRPLLEDPGVEKRLFDAKGFLHAIAPYGVRLAGPAFYFGRLCEKPTIGDDTRPIAPADILRANRMAWVAGVLCLALLCAARAALAGLL